MPRLNDSNQATTGYLVSWFDENRTIFQDCSTGICNAALSDGTILQENVPSAYIYGHNKLWVAEVPGKLVGSFGEIPGASLDRYIDPIGPDGSLVYKRVRDSFGPWGFFNGPDFGGDCHVVQNLGDRKALWVEGTNWILHSNFGFSKDGLRCYSMRLKGDDFLYQSVDGSLILNDRIIQPTGNYYRPDFNRSGDNFHIVWSTIEGEPFTIVLDLTLAELLQKPLVGTTPNPVAGNKMIRAFEHPFWQSPYYSHHQRYGDTDINHYREYANAITIIGDEQDENVRDTELVRLSQHGMPLIVDIGTHPPSDEFLNLTVAWLASGNSIASLWNSVGQALQYSEKPIIAYLDNDDWPINNPFNSVRPDKVWPAIQAYRFPDESLEAFRNRLEIVIGRVANYGLHMVLTSRFDDFNGDSTIERTLECMPLYESWIRNYKMGHMPFADRRGNGIAKHESLFEFARAFNYAIPFGRPNRNDYWRSENSTIKSILENKFGQSRASVVLEPYLREDILGKYKNGNEPVPNGNEVPTLNARQIDIIWELYMRNKDLAESHDDDRRILTRMICEQFKFEFGPKWGTKSTTSGHPQSKDSIAYKVNGSQLHQWDWQNGDTRKPQLSVGQKPDHEFLDHHFIVVESVNHLG